MGKKISIEFAIVAIFYRLSGDLFQKSSKNDIVGLLQLLHPCLNQVSMVKTSLRISCVFPYFQILSFFWSEYRKMRIRKNSVFGSVEEPT